MKLPDTRVQEVAKLAKLRLNEDEVSLFSEQLSHILEHIDQLNQLNTEAVLPLSHVFENACPVREDHVLPDAESEKLISKAPSSRDRYFTVPKIIDQG